MEIACPPHDHVDDRTRAQEARAASVVYEALAAALLNLPDARIVTDTTRIASLLGSSAFDDPAAIRIDEQRYNDRFFVSSSACFVPLSESCVRGAAAIDGIVRFGNTADAGTDHVARCFRAVGFDERKLAGHPLAVRSLRVDSLASELAFIAFLARSEAHAGEAEHTQGAGSAQRALQRAFLAEHLGCWIDKAARLVADTGEDFYARVVALAAAWVRIDQDRVA